jgi:type IV pilus assembly protein PilA
MINRTKKAFTMLELIVVIVILGIIAGLAVPSFLSVTTKSKKAVAEENVRAAVRKAAADAAFDADWDGTVAAITATYLDEDGTTTCTVSGSRNASGEILVTDSCDA